MSINYDGKKFKVLNNSNQGEVSQGLIFEYSQSGSILSCSYSGGEIVSGHLIGLVDEKGVIEMRYHQVNAKGQLRSGKCISKPKRKKSGKIQLFETWKWDGKEDVGHSVLEEI